MDGAFDRVGDAPKRREDVRFATGGGCYLDDMAFDGLAHAAFVRSPHAHARVRGVERGTAAALPGVLAVLTAADALADGLKPLQPYAAANTVTGEPFAADAQPLIADRTVRFVGEIVAVVIARTKAAALDGAEAVAVDYEPLPAVVTGLGALEAGAPQLSPAVPGNVCMDWRVGAAAAVAAAFSAAAHTVEARLFNHRVVTNPMEPRGGVGCFDPATGRYTLHVSSQNVHGNRNFIAAALGAKPADVRWVAPDVGGGFGAKNFGYVEQALLLWAARRTACPVKWIASRSEVFLTDHQARDHDAAARLALDADGRFLALEIDSVANLGAYMIGNTGGVHTNQYAHLPGTVYGIPDVAMRVRTVLSNTTPIGVTRGPGFAEMVNILERLVDRAAAVSGIDRADLRRRNFVPASAMPRTNGFGYTVDSGDFPKAFEAALALADVAGFPERRRGSPKRLGLGFACHIKATGGSPDENVEIRFRADGGVDLITGTQTIGQGHETTFAQLVTDRLGVPNQRVRLIHGDTDAIANGGGHGSSRATYMAGTAIWRASEAIVEKARPVAARMLEAEQRDITFDAGVFRVTASNRAVDILAVAARARDDGEPLDMFYGFTRDAMTYPNGTHVAEVEVDPETGVVRLLRYTAVDDYGVLVNPMVAAGQVHGGIAQGVGQALLEQTVHDPATGQPLTGSFMDYALPRADDLPSFDLAYSPTRCTTNPFGVKGCGEAGAIAGYPAINLAILDALAELGVTDWRGAATPETIWRAIQAAKA